MRVQCGNSYICRAHRCANTSGPYRKLGACCYNCMRKGRVSVIRASEISWRIDVTVRLALQHWNSSLRHQSVGGSDESSTQTCLGLLYPHVRGRTTVVSPKIIRQKAWIYRERWERMREGGGAIKNRFSNRWWLACTAPAELVVSTNDYWSCINYIVDSSTIFNVKQSTVNNASVKKNNK